MKIERAGNVVAVMNRNIHITEGLNRENPLHGEDLNSCELFSPCSCKLTSNASDMVVVLTKGNYILYIILYSNIK